MISIALTGGVATGKSTVLEKFQSHWGKKGAIHSADVAVHELLTTDPIKTRITAVFGDSVLDADGEIDRGELRRIVFRDEPLRRKLEGILHPEVQAMGQEFEAQAIKERKERLVYEIPLLYEIDSKLQRDYDVVVAASEEIQRKRMTELRDLEPETIENLIKAQMPLEQKMARADFVIWNDASIIELEEQVRLLTDWIDREAPENVKYS